MRNTAIEKSLDRKMKPRYLGPVVVVSRNKGGAYIVAELNGAVYDRPVAAFRLIPYFPRESIPLPLEVLDIDAEGLRRLEDGVAESLGEEVDATDALADCAPPNEDEGD